jgi:3-hydroxyisobutyrate dehydrogenase-like beta-hydroxyacid dehydrogenase
MQHIGFIGASGLMGHGMARNIRAKGFDLSITVHQRTAPVQDLLACLLYTSDAADEFPKV